MQVLSNLKIDNMIMISFTERNIKLENYCQAFKYRERDVTNLKGREIYSDFT